MKARAVRLHAANDLRLDTFELPEIRDDEILVKVVSDSICMSTYKCAILGTEHKRVHPDVAEHPAIMGHEFAGDIVKVGAKHQDKFKPGMKFTLQPALNYKGTMWSPGYSYEFFGGDATYCIIPAEGKPLARAYDLLLPLEKRVQTWLDTPAGHLDLPLVSEDHLKAALNGSDLANFINTVQLEASGAQIASSALPNEFKGLPTEVTIRDVVSTYIYTNTLVVLEMTRPALKQYIERSAAYFDHDEDGNLCIADEFLRPKVQHYNYDFFSGIHYTIDARNPVGQRVTSIVLDGRELGEDEPVTVCVNSYRFCGTGGYDMLPRQKVAREVLTDVADAMIDYITSHPNIRVDTEKYCTVIG